MKASNPISCTPTYDYWKCMSRKILMLRRDVIYGSNTLDSVSLVLGTYSQWHCSHFQPQLYPTFRLKCLSTLRKDKAVRVILGTHDTHASVKSGSHFGE